MVGRFVTWIFSSRRHSFGALFPRHGSLSLRPFTISSHCALSSAYSFQCHSISSQDITLPLDLIVKEEVPTLLPCCSFCQSALAPPWFTLQKGQKRQSTSPLGRVTRTMMSRKGRQAHPPILNHIIRIAMVSFLDSRPLSHLKWNQRKGSDKVVGHFLANQKTR